MKKFLCSLLLSYLLLPIFAVANVSYTKLVVFGDSLSDNGNLYKNTHHRAPNPPYYKGRFSNGPVWVEVLSTQLNIPLEDYAVGGAQTSGGYFKDIRSQINAYLKAENSLDPQNLYIIWGGGNNYFFHPQREISWVNETILDLKIAITKLAQRGAKVFLIPNLPALEASPWAIAQDTAAKNNDYTQHMAVLIQAHNAQLKTAVVDLENNLPIKIIYFDVYALFKDAILHPQKYALKNIHQACYEGNFRGELDKPVCKDPQNYLFWDVIHPTAGVHQYIEVIVAKLIKENN